MLTNTVQFDLTARREKNLRVLKSIDENVIEVLADYSHVAVYQFDSSLRSWERLDVEGSLFITRSAIDPLYSVIVLNKKGPSDFTLDILSIRKLSLQRPYIMMRCSAPGAAITFGIWSHNEAELDAIYALLVRIALSKESPVAPPSPQAKAGQLLSMLKPKKDTAGSSSLSPKSPVVSSNTATAVSAKVSAPQTPGTGGAESASKKSAALLSLLKPSAAPAPELENRTTQVNIEGDAVSSKLDSAPTSTAMSMQLLSILKSPSAAKTTNATASATTPSVISSIPVSQVANPSSSQKAAPVPPSTPASGKEANSTKSSSNQSAQKSLEDQRAEMMLKLIKPRTTTVDDLLTDVDIAARVKAASAEKAEKAADNSAQLNNNALNSKLTQAGETPVATSKEDMLKNILMNKSKPAPAAESVSPPLAAPILTVAPAPSFAPAAAQVSPSSKVSSTVNAIPVPLAAPSAFKSASVSPTTTTAVSAEALASATALFNQQGSSTQRSAELLAAALRNTANSIRAVQMGTQRSPLASPVLTSLYGPPIPSPSPAPAAAPSGLPAPVAWASLSNGNLAGASGKVATAAPAPARPVPVLISPSDLRNIAAAAATTASR